MATIVGLILLVGLAPPAGAATSANPIVGATYPGVSNELNDPPSGTIAANKAEVVELANTGFEVVTSKGTVTSGTVEDLFKANGRFLSDPQVIWDAATNRFYVSIFENHGTSSPNDGLAWGFSKTAHPSSAKDFCTYFNTFNYGATSFPDQESLGDTTHFLMIASNRYSVPDEDTLGSDVAWISKPPAGRECPASTAFNTGIQSLANPDGSWAYRPTPARQVDTNSTGWIAATTSYVSADTLTMFHATENGNSLAIGSPRLLPVPEYSYPPPAPQGGLTKSGELPPPLETRIYLTQVIEAYDPRLGSLALWTAHTIAGGAGSAVRWYEINPANLSLDQTGTITDPQLWLFNATVTPDRVVNGNNSGFGSSAVVEYNTSSSSAYPAIRMESIVDGQAPSPPVLVKQSTGPNVDFSCFQPDNMPCRWGDYSGAVPDPGSPLTAEHGQVWLVNQWNLPDLDDQTPVWQTSIWNATFSNSSPTTAVVIPASNTSVSGSSTLLDAAGTDTVPITSITYELNGGTATNKVVATATPTLYGWLAYWDTTDVPNGTYTLASVLTDADHITVTSPGVTVKVAN